MKRAIRNHIGDVAAILGLLILAVAVAGYILERGRAVVLALNKWDKAGKEAREKMKSEVAWKLGFLSFAEVHTISAKEGKGLPVLMRSVDAAFEFGLKAIIRGLELQKRN